jgi:hypothetical protein
MADNPHIADVVARETARTNAVYLFLKWSFERLNLGLPPSDYIYVAAKIVGPEQGWLTIDRSLQLLGGRGYLEPNGVARIARDARVLRIFEGPTEALTSYLGGLLSIKPLELEMALNNLAAQDLFTSISPVLSAGDPRRPENKGLDRGVIQRRQYRAGELAAYALFFAVVRLESSTDAGNLLAVRIAEEAFTEVACRPFQSESWCCRSEAEALGLDLDNIIGDIAERKEGFSRNPSPGMEWPSPEVSAADPKA